MGCTLIIPAAGRGTRFGADRPKQFLPIHGRPVLAWTLAAFAGLVDAAILAGDPLFADDLAAIAGQAPFPCRVVAGGATRQASVQAALVASDPAHALVLVHDAVRPLVPRPCIEACLAALAEHVAAVVAVPCAATVKRQGPGRLVAETVPREGLWLAQTPQGFRRAEGLIAFAAAGSEECTDDAQVLERAGFPVALVPGDARNLKITTPDDLQLAMALLAHS